MAALIITAANVGIGTNARTNPAVVGQATTHGIVLYIDTTDDLYKPADADAAITGRGRCISLTAATGTGLPVVALFSGDIVLGAILTAGTDYYVGTTPGTIVPRADLGSGDFIQRIGRAISTTVLRVDFDQEVVEIA